MSCAAADCRSPGRRGAPEAAYSSEKRLGRPRARAGVRGGVVDVRRGGGLQEPGKAGGAGGGVLLGEAVAQPAGAHAAEGGGDPGLRAGGRPPGPRAVAPGTGPVRGAVAAPAWQLAGAAERGPGMTPEAPSARAARRPRPSAMPPAAIIGIPSGTATASTICGTRARVPTSEGGRSLTQAERCPPASLPCATMADRK